MCCYYLPLKKCVVLYLKTTRILFTNADTLWQVWLRLTQHFLRRSYLKIVNIFSFCRFYMYLHLQKGLVLPLNWIPFTHGNFMPSLVGTEWRLRHSSRKDASLSSHTCWDAYPRVCASFIRRTVPVLEVMASKGYWGTLLSWNTTGFPRQTTHLHLFVEAPLSRLFKWSCWFLLDHHWMASKVLDFKDLQHVLNQVEWVGRLVIKHVLNK